MKPSDDGWKIDRVWRHAHDNRPNVDIDFHGKVMRVVDKDPPYRYMICVSKGDDVRVHSLWAVDELDAVKQFLKEK